MPNTTSRWKRALGGEPDLTWLEADAAQLKLPDAKGEIRQPRRRYHLQGNAPLIMGGLIVFALFLVVLFGPLLAPENPYLAGQRVSMIIDGNYTTPPFPPTDDLPLGTDQWGRDILSMLLYGTRNTLVACLFIGMARILLGFTLGMLAGWNEGGLWDGVVMGLVELTTALPALLTGMILIFALGIQRGITVFIVALCFVGWAEIAQYVRSEFMVIRRKPFVDGARVIGLDGLGIAIRHILPNLLPSLVIIAVLEMGAVLMILGELGFVGVFMGGGTWVQVGDTTVANIPDIPEWGAMMAGVRQFARSKTWMVFYPAMAFFAAVLGFNLLGEGLRRIVQRRGVSTSFILSKRMVLVIAAVTLATAYIVTHVGPAPSYAGLAQHFDGQAAFSHVVALTSSETEGRQAGTRGAETAAAYISERFLEYGLKPIKFGLEFRLPWTTQVVAPVTQPVLALWDEAQEEVVQSFSHRTDFGVDINGHGGSGDLIAPVMVCYFPTTPLSDREFKGLDLRGHIVLYWTDNAPPGFQVEALIRGAVGLLIVDEDITPRLQIADPDRDYLRRPQLPILRILPATADAILAPDGLSVEQLIQEMSQYENDHSTWKTRELSHRAHMRVALSPVNNITTDNVLGLLEGSDATLNKQLVIVAAHYDSPGRQPDGGVLEGANSGASGVATMLEILNLWRARGFQPRRTMVFAAWAGGEWEHSGAHQYLEQYARYSATDTVAVMNLDGLGRGGEKLLAAGSSELVDLLLRSALSSGVSAEQGETRYFPYQRAFTEAELTIGWSDAFLPPRRDTADTISASKLAQAGQAINLALITISREYDY